MGYMTRAQMQRESGRSRADVDRLLALGLPHEHTGVGRGSEIRIPRDKALAWFAAFVLDARADPESTPDFTSERTRLAKEQADKLQLENAVARGELLPAREVAKADEIIFAGIRDRVMAVQSVAPLLCDAALKDDEQGLRPILREALTSALENVGSAELVEA
jgi:phage terminase Nu1 subunit (DNA packaging protein)